MIEKYSLQAKFREMALAHFKDELGQDPKLGGFLLKLNFELGEFFSFLPGDLPVRSMTDFRKSVFLTFGKRIKNESIDQLLREIVNHVNTPGDSIVVLGTNWREGAPILKKRNLPYIIYDKEIYTYLDKSELEEGLAEKVIRFSSTYPFICCFSHHTNIGSLKTKEEVTSGYLGELAKNASMVAVGAFDSEGYLFWKKQAGTANP